MVMSDISTFVSQAHLTCESCEFVAEDTGAAMTHALTGHVISGETPDGDTITISIEPIEE